MAKPDRRPVTAGRDAMIVARLDEWGEWLARQLDRAGAGSLVSGIYSGRPVVQTSAQAGQEARAVSEAALTNRLVVDLGQVDKALQLAVFVTHAPRGCRIGDGVRAYEGGRGLSLRQNARRLGCSHTALAARLARADLMLLGWLRDHAAGQHRHAERERSAVALAKWQPPAGCRVVLWPDCDAKRAKGGAELPPSPAQPGVTAAM